MEKQNNEQDQENNNEKEAKKELLWTWFFRALILAIFIMACISTHYILKIWKVWQVVERLPQT